MPRSAAARIMVLLQTRSRISLRLMSPRRTRLPIDNFLLLYLRGRSMPCAFSNAFVALSSILDLKRARRSGSGYGNGAHAFLSL